MNQSIARHKIDRIKQAAMSLPAADEKTVQWYLKHGYIEAARIHVRLALRQSRS